MNPRTRTATIKYINEALSMEGLQRPCSPGVERVLRDHGLYAQVERVRNDGTFYSIEATQSGGDYELVKRRMQNCLDSL